MVGVVSNPTIANVRLTLLLGTLVKRCEHSWNDVAQTIVRANLLLRERTFVRQGKIFSNPELEAQKIRSVKNKTAKNLGRQKKSR